MAGQLAIEKTAAYVFHAEIKEKKKVRTADVCPLKVFKNSAASSFRIEKYLSARSKHCSVESVLMLRVRAVRNFIAELLHF
jgi:hypothetical protein